MPRRRGPLGSPLAVTTSCQRSRQVGSWDTLFCKNRTNVIQIIKIHSSSVNRTPSGSSYRSPPSDPGSLDTETCLSRKSERPGKVRRPSDFPGQNDKSVRQREPFPSFLWVPICIQIAANAKPASLAREGNGLAPRIREFASLSPLFLSSNKIASSREDKVVGKRPILGVALFVRHAFQNISSKTG